MNIISGKKKYEKGVEHVIAWAKIDKIEELDTLEYIEKKQGDTLACMRFLGTPYKAISSKNLLIDKDIKKCRLNSYIYSKLYIMGASERSCFRIGYSSNIFGILLCNNKDFIKFLVNNFDVLTYKKRRDTISNDYGHLYLTATILYALKGEMEEVKRRCELYLKNPLKQPKYKYKEYDFEFLKALSEKDEEKMKKLINIMLEPKIARKVLYDTNVFYDFYLHLYVIIYGKVALYNGIDLGIDCEVAPKELIDNTPLEEYQEPYEFMKEFDLGKITPEEWREWIYRWHPDPEELRDTEEKGFLI